MKEILSDLIKWQQADAHATIAIATVIQTWGSAPRKVGAKMALTPDGSISGSVSGGCVEGAVFEAGTAVLANQQPQLLHFGVADETAWEVGLACGGVIELFVEPMNPTIYTFMQALISEEQAGATITIIQGPTERLGEQMAIARNGRSVGTLNELTEMAVTVAQAATTSHRLQITPEIELFIDVYRPAPTLIMVGGVHIAITLTTLAKTVGYKTIVIDPRRAFGSSARFPHVDQLIQSWPQKAFAQIELTPETAVALLTHDPKIDDPALAIVLRQPVFYIGALGSKKTHNKRKQRLIDSGFDEATIQRIHGPIGLNINAQTPEEIALAIIAQIVQIQRT